MAQNEAFGVENIIYLIDMTLSRQLGKLGHLYALQENQWAVPKDLFILGVGMT
jgi:hypothetical protein